ncbi:hypothetical protein [Labilibaculum sp.]|uniref:hypothetical protein n=1 Tax=Labilibaculum sp. TaxID=2060723 RepID=UPI002AA8B436|nr:hypothetical protein [Labilibaculum sp.]
MNDSRFYHCSDAVFISWASNFINLIKEEQAKFSVFSVYFTPERIAEIEVLFNEANNIPSDKVYIDIQAEATAAVNSCVEKCAKFFQACKFDIEMVFANKKHIWNQFGFNDYEEARKSGRNMFMFYSDFLLIANLHKEALLKGAWKEETYLKIADYKDSLKIYMDQQTKCRVDRSRAADERVVSLNKLYEMLSMYQKAAKIIYIDNEEMLKWFKFPVTVNGKKEEAEVPLVEAEKDLD